MADSMLQLYIFEALDKKVTELKGTHTFTTPRILTTATRGQTPKDNV